MFQLEETQQQVYHEQQKQQCQKEQFLQQFQNEVRKVEELQKVHQNTTQTIVREVPKTAQNLEVLNHPPFHPFLDLILYPKMKHPVNNGYGSLKKPLKRTQQLL